MQESKSLLPQQSRIDNLSDPSQIYEVLKNLNNTNEPALRDLIVRCYWPFHRLHPINAEVLKKCNLITSWGFVPNKVKRVVRAATRDISHPRNLRDSYHTFTLPYKFVVLENLKSKPPWHLKIFCCLI